MNVACYKSHGFSMEPFVLDGDELIVNTSPSVRYAVGDIVLYRSLSFPQPVAHRLVWFDRKSSSFIVRADANPHMSESLTEKAILGRVEYLRRGETLVRVNGTIATSLFNCAVAILQPFAVRLKNGAVWLLLPAITRLQSMWFYRRCVARLAAPDIRIDRSAGARGEARVVATIRGRYAGSLDLKLRDLHGTHISWAFSLYVRVRYRGVGIGTRLVEAAEKCLEEASMRVLWVELEKGNRAAEGLYRKMGFHGVAPGDGESREGRLVLCKIIDRSSPISH